MLPVNSKPLKNESFMSWFSRLSFLNGTDPKGLALYVWDKDSQLYKDLDRQLSNEEISKLTKLTKVSYKEIQQLTLYPYIKKVNSSKKDTTYNKWYFLLPLGQKGRIRINGTSICPKCLNEKISFINKFWRISWVLICPIHNLKLISHCPNCQQAILPQKLNYLRPNIYLCHKCDYDLRKTKTDILKSDLHVFQNKLLSTLISGNITSKENLNLLLTNSAKDLFLTLQTLLAFFHKVLRNKNRFIHLIRELNLNDNHTFVKQNNATFNRLSIDERIVLLGIVSIIFHYDINEFIKILQKTGVTANILKQTFKNISPTIKYIMANLSDKKLKRSSYKQKRTIKPKSIDEVEKLFLEIKPFLKNNE